MFVMVVDVLGASDSYLCVCNSMITLYMVGNYARVSEAIWSKNVRMRTVRTITLGR